MSDDRAPRLPRTKTAPVTIDPLREPAFLVPPVEPSGARVIGRVFGYLGLTLVWLLLLGVVVFATVVALWGALGSATVNGGLGGSPGWHSSDAWLAPFAIPLAAAVMGILTVYLVLATLGLLLAAATLFVRSLNPAYRHEQLSLSTRTRGGEALGGVATAFTGVSLSLVPVRLTRWSKVVTMVQFNGWIINGGTLALGCIWGLLYWFTLGWTLWPATGAAVPVCVAVTVALAAWFLFEIWRRRRSYATVMPSALEGTVYESSWPNRPENVAAKSAGKKKKPAKPKA